MKSVLFVAAVIAAWENAEATCDKIEYTIFPETTALAECSSQGVCVAGICQCNNGWTGRSDFMNTEGLDCQINEIAIVVLWGINLVSTLYSAYKSYPNVVARWSQYRTRVAELRSRGKDLPLKRQSALLASLTVMCLGYPFMGTVAIFRMAKWDERVGVTFGMTFFFAVVRLVFYFSNYLYAPSLLTSLLRGTKFKKDRIQTLVRRNKIAYRILTTTSVLCGFIMFVPYAVEGDLGTAEQAAYTTYFALMVVCMISYAGLFHYIKIAVVEVLDESIKITGSEKTMQLRDKLIAVMKSGRKQAAIQLFIYGIFLFWPELWNKHDYFLPVSWLAFNQIGRDLCLSTIRDEPGSKTGGRGSKSDSKSSDNVSNRELSPVASPKGNTTNLDSAEEYI